VPARDSGLLRSIKTLELINNVPVTEFWKKPENQAGGTPATATGQ